MVRKKSKIRGYAQRLKILISSLGWGAIARLGLTPVGLGYYYPSTVATLNHCNINYLSIIVRVAMLCIAIAPIGCRAFKRDEESNIICLSIDFVNKFYEIGKEGGIR